MLDLESQKSITDTKILTTYLVCVEGIQPLSPESDVRNWGEYMQLNCGSYLILECLWGPLILLHHHHVESSTRLGRHE